MIYESECSKCNKLHEFVASVAECNNTPTCCNTKTVRVFTCAPQIGAMSSKFALDIHMPDGKNNGKGSWISSGSDYKKFMDSGKYYTEADGKVEAERARKRNKEKADAARRKAVEKAVYSMTA